MPVVETEAATTTEEMGETQDRFTEENRGGVLYNKAPPMVT